MQDKQLSYWCCSPGRFIGIVVVFMAYRILIIGGTGLIGQHLTHWLVKLHQNPTILSRRDEKDLNLPASVRAVKGDPTQKGDWQELVPLHNVIINLAGENIFGRWTKKKKEKILKSRIDSTRNIVEALEHGQKGLLFNASGVSYYGDQGDEKLDENSFPGSGFLPEVSQDWEREAIKAKEKGVRVVLGRLGLVLSNEGGALETMVKQFKWLAGGRTGSGRQWISWIHMLDLMRAIMHIIKNKTITGPVNLVSPNPVRNKDFAKSMGEVLKKPAKLITPKFVLRLALGELSWVALQSQYAVPMKLNSAMFSWKFSVLLDALQDLLGKPK